MAAGAAFRYFIGGFSPSYASQTIHPKTVNKHLIELSTEVNTAITAKLRAQHDSVTKLGWYGPFVGIQMDMTVFNTEYITVALSFVSEDWCMERVTVCMKAFNGKSLSWMGLTREWWCCTVGLVSRLDMNTCQTSIKTDILLEHC